MEKEISQLHVAVNDIKTALDKFVGILEEKLPYQESVVRTAEKRTNPWALQTTHILTSAMNIKDTRALERYAKANYETYKPTIDALASSQYGLGADGVAKKTRRSRNTESAYLWRLYLSGLIGRSKRKNRVIYTLKDKQKVLSAFGLR